jgi:hypothetical protein
MHIRHEAMAGCVALVLNWCNLFVCLADPCRHREAITSRPLLLQAIRPAKGISRDHERSLRPTYPPGVNWRPC